MKHILLHISGSWPIRVRIFPSLGGGCEDAWTLKIINTPLTQKRRRILKQKRQETLYTNKTPQTKRGGFKAWRMRMVAEGKRKNTKRFFGTQSKARAGWRTRLRLIWATAWADFAVITTQLWSTMTVISSWVKNCFQLLLWPSSWDYCQIFQTTDPFLLNTGLFVFSISEMLWDTCICSNLHKDSNLDVSSNSEEQFFRKWTHHQYLDGQLGQYVWFRAICLIRYQIIAPYNCSGPHNVKDVYQGGVVYLGVLRD